MFLLPLPRPSYACFILLELCDLIAIEICCLLPPERPKAADHAAGNAVCCTAPKHSLVSSRQRNKRNHSHSAPRHRFMFAPVVEQTTLPYLSSDRLGYSFLHLITAHGAYVLTKGIMSGKNKLVQRNNISQNNLVFEKADGRKDPAKDNSLNENERLFDEKFRDLVTAALGTTDESEHLSGIAANMEKASTKALFDSVVENYKTMKPDFSKATWKITIANAKAAREGQRRQMQAVDAIDEALKDRMKRES